MFCALRCFLAGLVLVGMLVVAFFLGAGWLLALPAEQPAKADVAVALGGSPDRLDHALALLDAGWVKHVIAIQPDSAKRRAIGDRYGSDGPVHIEDRPANTWQEAESTKAWMKREGWKRVMVVSDPPHLLRADYAFASVLRDTDATYRLIATPADWWSAMGWWRQPQSFQYVGSEWVKLGYYVLHYGYGLGFSPQQLDKRLLASTPMDDR